MHMVSWLPSYRMARVMQERGGQPLFGHLTGQASEDHRRALIHQIKDYQKKALGMVECSPEEKAAAARTAMLFSRTNTLLSFPMLFAMVSAQNIYYLS